MIDLFGKKKIKAIVEHYDKELERNNEIITKIMLDNEKLRKELEGYRIVPFLIKRNNELHEWIEKILDMYGTMQVNENHIKIPVIKSLYQSYDKNSFCKPVVTKRIEIPAITIEKTEFVGDEK